MTRSETTSVVTAVKEESVNQALLQRIKRDAWTYWKNSWNCK
jgi:hypothetical protein